MSGSKGSAIRVRHLRVHYLPAQEYRTLFVHFPPNVSPMPFMPQNLRPCHAIRHYS